MSDEPIRGNELPVIIECPDPGASILSFIADQREDIRRQLAGHGAVLLRGFDVADAGVFNKVVEGLSGPALVYNERSSPRSTIQGQIYTSTDYPPDEEIFLHNENSYQASWPLTLYFYCITPPGTLGATTLADIRLIYESIDEAVRKEFIRRRWMVVRNFHDNFGTRWQYVFNTDDRAQVAGHCRRNGIEVEWRQAGLRTRAVRDAVHRHPVTGQEVWFNHATFFHVTTIAKDVREGLLEIFDEDDLPVNTYFGDGGRIPDDVMAHLRDCYRSAVRRFDYEQSDILVVDNMGSAHGREPFTGPRKIAVAMAEPFAVPG